MGLETWRYEVVDQHVRVAGELLRGAGREGLDSCVLVGSLTAGYGTPYSDVDLLVFTMDEAADPSWGGGGEYRVDVETFTLRKAGDLVESLAGYAVHAGDTAQLYRVSDAIELFCRLRSAPRVLTDSPGLRSLLARCEEVTPVATRLRVSRATLLANNTLEDTLGFLEVGDLHSALQSAYTMFQFGLDAFNCALGDTYFGHKWNIQRMRSVLADNAGYQAGILELLVAGAGSDADVRSAVYRRIEVNQQLLATANLVAWLPYPAGVTLPRAAAGLRRDPRWLLLKYSDRWVLSDGRRSYAVPWTAVAVWGLSGGLTAPELAEAATQQIGNCLGRPVPASLSRSLMDKLLEMGALVLESIPAGSP